MQDLEDCCNPRLAHCQPSPERVSQESKSFMGRKTTSRLTSKTVLFTDEMRATFDGPDGWAKPWTPQGSSRPQRIYRQQGGGSVFMWAGILENILVVPFQVPEGVKITSLIITSPSRRSIWFRG